MPNRVPIPRPGGQRRGRVRTSSGRTPARRAREGPGPSDAPARDRAPLNRSERIRLGASGLAGVALLLLLACCLESGCGRETWWNRVAFRVLEDHRKKAAARPLPAAGSIRIRLSPAGAAGGEGGTAEIEWAGERYRETVASAGVSTVRGIQAGKAFFTDEDGVTRVGSEPMLAELRTRSYFWRRAYLFEDHERAKIFPGPTDEQTVSVRLRPRGGNDLILTFDRRTSALTRVSSPRFHLEFESPARFRDVGPRPAAGDITWTGLPTRRLPDPVVGGWRGSFSQPSAEAELARADGGISIPARISGVPVRLSIDADAAGPLRISPELAKKANLGGRRDVFGRLLGQGATLEVGSFSATPLHVEIVAAGASGVDAVAGGPLFRETVVEIDPEASRLRLHDPARWVAPEGFGRTVIDDDGDLPVAILFRSGRRLRLRSGTSAAPALLLPAESTARDGLDPKDSFLPGLVWGTVRLPPLPLRRETGRFDPDWGDDGAMGFPLLLRFRVFIDMPHRWMYARPL